jgi:hypothetical protein
VYISIKEILRLSLYIIGVPEIPSHNYHLFSVFPNSQYGLGNSVKLFSEEFFHVLLSLQPMPLCS